MRKQYRPEQPLFLQENAAKWNARWAERKKQKPNTTFTWSQFTGVSVREHLRPTLYEMNQGHCSFCDSFPLGTSSTEPIEHFRPKSKPEFYHLAYDWGNLYYCCELCNSTKGEQWHDELLAPDSDDYRFEQYFEFDFTTGEIQPNSKASKADQARARVTIDMYGLNIKARPLRRRTTLRQWTNLSERCIDDFPFRDFLESELR